MLEAGAELTFTHQIQLRFLRGGSRRQNIEGIRFAIDGEIDERQDRRTVARSTAATNPM